MSENKTPKVGKLEKAMSVMASEDNTRYVLQGLYFDTEDGTVAVTDGRCMAFSKMEFADNSELNAGLASSEPVQSQIVPSDKVREVVTEANKHKTKNLPGMNDAFLHNGKLVANNILSGDSHCHEFKKIDGTYPNWKQVVPSKDANLTRVKQIALSPLLLSKMLKIAESVKSEIVVISVYESATNKGEMKNLQPVEIEIINKEQRQVSCVIMPMRVD
jgi:DNA polymerase III sliding clamp (beta) subunit (PCNA family)